jgi:hypothetical protein
MAKRKRDGSDANLQLPAGVDAQAIARRMEQEHGCEAVTVDQRRGKVLGLRYGAGDVAHTHKEIDIEHFQRRTRTRGPRLIFLPPRGRK